VEIPLHEIKDWYQFQHLVAAYFRSLSGERNQYHIADTDVEINGIGPDDGIDILVTFHYLDAIKKHTLKWIIECKGKEGNGSIGLPDLDTNNILALLKAKKADGYLLVCKGNASNKLKTRFRELSTADEGKFSFEIWEGFVLWHKISERESLLRTFFPDYYNKNYIENRAKERFDALVNEFQAQLEKKDVK